MTIYYIKVIKFFIDNTKIFIVSHYMLPYGYHMVIIKSLYVIMWYHMLSYGIICYYKVIISHYGTFSLEKKNKNRKCLSITNPWTIIIKDYFRFSCLMILIHVYNVFLWFFIFWDQRDGARLFSLEKKKKIIEKSWIQITTINIMDSKE